MIWLFDSKGILQNKTIKYYFIFSMQSVNDNKGFKLKLKFKLF